MPNTTVSTTLLESVNIVLANLGESPVNTLSGNALPQQVSLALNTIEEVSTDIQSKGWWFNQQTASAYDSAANIVIYPSSTANDWSSSIPEEARRYITIRSSRIAQTRLIGSEELQKFSYNEELVSLAILQQAHVRNSNGELTFTDFPSELRNLGIDEVMFLQGTVEEKIGTIRLGGELASINKAKAETTLLGQQSTLVGQQAITESVETTKRTREAELIDAQEALIQKQVLTEAEQVAKVQEEVDLLQKQETLVTNQAATELKKALDLVADTTIKGKQGTLIDNQAATELKNALKVVAETSLINDQEALVVKQALTEVARATDLGADTTLKGKQGSLIDNQAATELKRALDLVADTTLKGKQGSLVDAQALDVAADTTLKGKQGSLVDAQATDVAADTTLKGKQGALVDAQELKTDAEAALIASQTTTDATQRTLIAAQELKTDAETVLAGKQGSLVDAQATDVAADTTLKGKQGALIDAQELKTDAETALTTKQGLLTDAQELKTDAEKLQVDAQTSLLASQKTELDAKTAIDVAAEKAFYDGVVAGTQATYRDFSAEMRIMGIQESLFQSTPAYKKVELLKDAEKLRTVTATELGTSTSELNEVNKVMRFIGEPPVSALNSNSLASECVRLLRDTDAELQGRGWWFNTEEDVEFSPSNGIISIPSNILSLEANDYEARIQAFGNGYRLYDLTQKSETSWSSTVKAKVVYQRSLNDTPSKYLEYLSVRVAILLTELYPQSGIDIQRLPKMEAELRAYFKDREADDANYSVFDNYDTASRIGINRNYDLN